jgi:hypothetical protein
MAFCSRLRTAARTAAIPSGSGDDDADESLRKACGRDGRVERLRKAFCKQDDPNERY